MVTGEKEKTRKIKEIKHRKLRRELGNRVKQNKNPGTTESYRDIQIRQQKATETHGRIHMKANELTLVKRQD